MSSTRQAQAERIDAEPPREVEQRRDLVGAALDHVAHPELAHARRHGGRAAAAHRGDRDAALHEQLDAVAVAHVERLERLAATPRSTGARR